MLTNLQNQMFYGAILGDSHVELNGNSTRVRFDHSIKQRDYIEWKYQILTPYCTSLRFYKVFYKRTQQYYEKVQLNSKTLPIFNPFRNHFYVRKKKRIPSNISDYLNSALALAIWYCDDGGKKKDCKAYRLHTNCFSFYEVELLQGALKKNFALESAIHKQGNEIIYIGAKNSMAERFCDIVKPIVASKIPSMLYKFY
jgi:hypothetical protein